MTDKATRMETLCLNELVRYLKDEGHEIIATWKVRKQGGKFARFQGGNDFLDAWDVAVLSSDRHIQKTLYLVQVKSRFSRKELKRLSKRAFGSRCYMAVYPDKNGRTPRDYIRRIGHFYYIKVD